MATKKANKSNWEIPEKQFKPDYNYRNNALNMDFYELRMAEGYFKLGLQDVKGIFDIFFRKNPAPKGKVSGYTIACGQEQLAKFLQSYHFDEHALNYLYYKGFDVDFIKYLSTYKWKGTMLAMPEGTICYPNEPVIRIECDVVGAFLIETYALQTFNLNSLIATKATHIVRAADGRDVMEFGGRRAQGEAASLYGARAAIIGGCSATANCLAEAVFGPDVPAVGTMSHAWVESYPNELDSFRAWAKVNPRGVSLLVDTYNALKRGVPNVIALDNELQKTYPGAPELWVKSIRLDSGDLAYQAKKARQMLDRASKQHIKIIASNSLDEDSIRSLIYEQKAPIDSFGVGEKLITSADCPVLGGVYKLTSLNRSNIWEFSIDDEWTPRMKCSDSLEKAIIPGKKMVYRMYDEEGKASTDIIAMDDEVIEPGKKIKVYTTDLTDARKEYEIIPENFKPLLVPFIMNGEVVREFPTVKEIRAYVQEQFNTAWESELRSSNPHIHYVDMTEKVAKTRQELYHKLHELV